MSERPEPPGIVRRRAAWAYKATGVIADCALRTVIDAQRGPVSEWEVSVTLGRTRAGATYRQDAAGAWEPAGGTMVIDGIPRRTAGTAKALAMALAEPDLYIARLGWPESPLDVDPRDPATAPHIVQRAYRAMCSSALRSAEEPVMIGTTVIVGMMGPHWAVTANTGDGETSIVIKFRQVGQQWRPLWRGPSWRVFFRGEDVTDDLDRSLRTAATLLTRGL